MSHRLVGRGSRQVQRRIPPEGSKRLVAGCLAGATAVLLAGKHAIRRTTAWLFSSATGYRDEGVSWPTTSNESILYASRLPCVSIGKELKVNPETVRHSLQKVDVAMRRRGRPRLTQESWAFSIGGTGWFGVLETLPNPPYSRHYRTGVKGRGQALRLRTIPTGREFGGPGPRRPSSPTWLVRLRVTTTDSYLAASPGW